MEDINFEKRLNKKALVAYLKKSWDKQGKKYTDTDIEDYVKPFNYEKIFKPYSQEELRKIVGGEVPIGSSEDLNIIDEVTINDSVDDTKKNEEKVKDAIVSIEDLLEP